MAPSWLGLAEPTLDPAVLPPAEGEEAPPPVSASRIEVLAPVDAPPPALLTWENFWSKGITSMKYMSVASDDGWK